MYRAYFVDGLNIALVENLLTVVRQLGLPEAEAREVLDSRRFRDTVDADWQRCRDLGVTAVPTFVVDDNCPVASVSCAVLDLGVAGDGAATVDHVDELGR